jgi:hypothetical protein
MKLLDTILENEDDERNIKKVKTIFKALNKKPYHEHEGRKFYFLLPDRYKVILNDTPEIEEYRSGRRQENDFLYVEVGNESNMFFNTVKLFYKEQGNDELKLMATESFGRFSTRLMLIPVSARSSQENS